MSSDEALTTLTVGHNFNGCSGTQTFSNLNISTVPNIICIPGPCPAPATRSLTFSAGTRGATPMTAVNGLFLPGGRAQGVVHFYDFPACGDASSVVWTATRR